MGSIGNWARGESVAACLVTLSLAVTLGLLLGAIPVRGVRLGVSGVMLAALLLGQVGLTVDAKVLGFLSDFALITFMYAIGLQVGPGFVSSLRAEGLRLNLLAAAVLVIGVVAAGAVGRFVGRAAAPGLFAGAFTTTAGLGAARETLHSRSGAGAGREAADRAVLAYSITYPCGVVAPIFIVVGLRRLFGVRMDEERKALAAAEERRRPPVDIVDFEVTESNYAGTSLRNCPLLRDNAIVFTRLLRNKVVTVPSADTLMQVGDVFRAVGPRGQLSELVSAMGRTSDGIEHAPGDVTHVDLLVTRTGVLHRPLRELDLIRRTGVTLARVNRAGVDLIPTAGLRLVFADRVTAVGPQAGLKMVEAELGNRAEKLEYSQLIPIFLGIFLGVILGSVPVALPGLHATVRIGLAGGSLLAAILLSQLGSVGSVVWYMPPAANQLFRDFGLALFLACIGLQAGDHFVQRAAQGGGAALLLWGAGLTVLPVILVGCFARLVLRMNFVTLSGWVAGTMTSTPALLFSGEMTASETPAVAYAAIAPLAELVPILCAQALAVVAL